MRKRQRFTPEFKARVVLDVLTGQTTRALNSGVNDRRRRFDMGGRSWEASMTIVLVQSEGAGTLRLAGRTVKSICAALGRTRCFRPAGRQSSPLGGWVGAKRRPRTATRALGHSAPATRRPGSALASGRRH